MQLRVRRECITIPSLPDKLDGFTILHVSDIHFNEETKSNQPLWDELHAKSADLILITGDFITHDSYIESLCKYLEGTKAQDGVYGILGNHDYYYRTFWQHFRHKVLGIDYVQNDWKRLVDSLCSIGIRVLVNEHVLIHSVRGSAIYLEGTDDPVLGRPVVANAGPEYLSSELKILMSHSPDILYSSEMQKKKFEILLSGHTHGGQIRVPGIGALLTGTDYATRKEAYGLYRKDHMNVNVSAGIGYSLLPLRINCPAEIISIELTGSPR